MPADTGSPTVSRALPHYPAYILAGGQSRRFGSDKARALYQGQPLLEHVAALFTPHTSSLQVIAGQAGQYDDLGWSTLADLYPGHGPMAGLQCALTHAIEGWVWLASCDVLGFQPSWLAALASASHNAPPTAVAFRDERWQPLFALYHCAILPIVTKALAQGRGAMWHLLDHIQATALSPPPGWSQLAQINTPQDLQHFHNHASNA